MQHDEMPNMEDWSVANYPPTDPPFPQPGKWWLSKSSVGRWVFRPGQPLYIAGGAMVCDASGPVWPSSEYRQMTPGDRIVEGGITSIALIRNGELGDVIACGAALRLVRAAYPCLVEAAVFCHETYAQAVRMPDVFFFDGKPQEHAKRLIVSFDLLLEYDHAHPSDAKCVRASRLEKVASAFNLYHAPAAII